MKEKRFKILVLNPPSENTIPEYPDPHGGKYIETEDFGHFPPLGALYVLSYLEANTEGHQLYFKDCVAEKMSYPELTAYIKEVDPDVVGITSFTLSLIDVLKTARLIRRFKESVHVCLGGHHPTAFPEEAAALDEFDSIVVGEGEIVFTELVKALTEGNSFAGIHGLYTSETIKNVKSVNDSRFINKRMVEPGYVEKIDELPVPNRKFIKHIEYNSILGVAPRLATVVTSRGCPFDCAFCDVPYKKYRERNAAKVVDEVEACLDMGYQEIHFYDDLFNITQERILSICDEINRRNLKFPWDFRGRINLVSRESLEAARKAGCRMISFGIETGTDEGLSRLKKGITVEQIRQVFAWCHELNIKTVVDFMIGLPTEKNEDDVRSNLDFMISLDPDYAQIALLTLYPHTELYSDAIAKGIAESGKWEEFSRNPGPEFAVDHWTEFIPLERLVQIRKDAYRKFYFRVGYILKSIKHLESLYQFRVKVQGVLKLLFS